TYDADNERDIGAPWYKPTRVLHLVSGGDYGWRHSTATFPEFRPDALPPVVNIGVGSPTEIEFGTRAKFPASWRRALFISDWAYGRILAVHMKPAGASYTGTSETFVSGRPLNVTDLAFGPDGAMYFVTGGRRTQSGLYRVSFVGPKEKEAEKSAEQLAETERCAELRKVRQRLEALHRPPKINEAKLNVEFIWPRLNHPDPCIRNAARVALEWQPFESWLGRFVGLAPVFGERPIVKTGTGTTYSTRALFLDDEAIRIPNAALLTVARIAESPLQREKRPLGDQVLTDPLSLNFFSGFFWVLRNPQQTRQENLFLLRIASVSLVRHPTADISQFSLVRGILEQIFPSADYALNHELVELLVFLKSPHVLAKTLPLMAKAGTSEELLRYLYCLRAVKDGWTPEARRAFLAALARAEAMQGAREYYRSLENIRAEFTASLSTTERLALRSLLEKKSATPPAVTAVARFVQEWKLADLEPHLDRVARGRDFAQGRGAFAAAQCVACHRVGSEGGVLGPDLTAIASRFGRRDVLIHILAPSLAIDDKFRQTMFVLKDGEAVTGTVESEDAEQVRVRQNLLSEETTTVRARDIRERRASDLSPMPEGLLNGLTLEQILDLLAFLEGGGSEKHAAFKR
ncbi:MAG: c-type cytochrome, partial [Verrucomicrobia bacterium]|nr:c-type cytochrome [Verrucomicrobiota bacterium]